MSKLYVHEISVHEMIDSNRSTLLNILDRLDSMSLGDQLVLLDSLATFARRFYGERYDSDYLPYYEE